MLDKLHRKPEIIYFIGLMLLIPALLINLGKLNIFMAVDEATRALVALEMMISKNFITPTINGEFYYHKPPLFPWILVVLYKLFGISEFVLRLPSAISLLGLGCTVFYFVSRALGKQTGIITAFLTVTTGRILFWESLLGYLDITFSWIVYTGIMFAIRFFRERKFLHLFIVSYFFMTLGFFMKGLPAIVFQGITFLVIFISGKEFRQLFTLRHFAGIAVFLIPTGIYYYLYSRHNSLANLMRSLWSESAGRTPVGNGGIPGWDHIYRYPLAMLYHYLPWSLMLVFLFFRGVRSVLFSNSFLKLSLLVALFNIIPYYISTEKMPKYIMMLVPMILTVFVFFYLKSKKENRKLVVYFEITLLVAGLLLTVSYLLIPVFDQFYISRWVILKSVGLFVVSSFFLFIYWKLKEHRLVLFAILLIVGRFAFDWFIWPQRAPQFEPFEKDALKIVELTGKKEIRYFHAPMLQYGVSYYLTKEKHMIIRKEKSKLRKDCYYITNDAGLDMVRKENDSVRIVYNYPNVEDGRNLNLIRIED